jgi:hypothetical protein
MTRRFSVSFEISLNPQSRSAPLPGAQHSGAALESRLSGTQAPDPNSSTCLGGSSNRHLLSTRSALADGE